MQDSEKTVLAVVWTTGNNIKRSETTVAENGFNKLNRHLKEQAYTMANHKLTFTN